MNSVMPFLLCLLCLLVSVNSGDDKGKEASNRAFDIASGLYTTLRNVAFQGHELTNNPGVQSRFLLLMPGKVLNYFDYFPGEDYINFLQNPSEDIKEAVIPPSVMEKWFDLADVMPTPNPMNGQDSGQSLAFSYSTIIESLRPLTQDSKTTSIKGGYAQAINYLNERVVDPDDSTSVAPRLTLYTRYRDRYNDHKLKMEQTIEEKRKSVDSINYEQWFQSHYRPLQAQVESAYKLWLVFGEKSTIESYLAYIDSGSSAKSLEEVRIALRASGVSSLDRTRTIYPVSFEPSDWYKYLLPEIQKAPSRDQLHMMQGHLIGQIKAIDLTIKSFDSNAQVILSVVQNLQQIFETQFNTFRKEMENYLNSVVDCLGGKKDSCNKIVDSQQKVLIAETNQSLSSFTYQYVNNFKDHESKKKYIESLEGMKSSLVSQSNEISALLGESSPDLGEFIDDSKLNVPDLDDSADDNWMHFEYNSDASSEDTTTKSVTNQMRVKVSVLGISVTHTESKTVADLNQKLSSSSMKVKGQLLRVTIKRPWFKPALFDTSDLIYENLSDDGGITYVSPGRELTETGFVDALSDPNIHYLLPEYSTSFLLARDIDLEFSGLDSHTVSHTMSQVSSTKVGGNFLIFKFSVGVTKTHTTSHVTTTKTANGMRISIPGAQIIGYYTEKLPRFPLNQ